MNSAGPYSRIEPSKKSYGNPRLCACGRPIRATTSSVEHAASTTPSRSEPAMTAKPRLLDLFCGAGGCSVGYERAGFEVVGVDIAPQPRYPFKFHQADALTFPLDGFDAIHASPPCQAHTTMRSMWNARQHEALISPIRERLIGTGLPYVIENVGGARSEMHSPFVICGASLGLSGATHDLARHRLFETNVPLMVSPCAHGSRPVAGFYGDHVRDQKRIPVQPSPWPRHSG